MMEMTETFPAVGREYEANFGGDYIYRLRFDSDSSMTVTGLAGATKDFTETVGIVVTRIRPGLYMVTWQEASQATVVHIEDFDQGVVYTNVTLPDHTFASYMGTLKQIE
jgi:hypothetical protein